MKSKLFCAILLLQAAYLVGTAWFSERALAHGRVIALETLPVDPRDLLRGDYLILNYKVSNVPLDRFAPPLSDVPPLGTTVYVVLVPNGEFYRLARASFHYPALQEGEVVLKGHVLYGWSQQSKTVRLSYGLERFYVPEGRGRPRGKLTVRVAVPASGQALIHSVLVDGKEYNESVTAER